MQKQFVIRVIHLIRGNRSCHRSRIRNPTTCKVRRWKPERSPFDSCDLLADGRFASTYLDAHQVACTKMSSQNGPTQKKICQLHHILLGKSYTFSKKECYLTDASNEKNDFAIASAKSAGLQELVAKKRVE